MRPRKKKIYMHYIQWENSPFERPHRSLFQAARLVEREDQSVNFSHRGTQICPFFFLLNLEPRFHSHVLGLRQPARAGAFRKRRLGGRGGGGGRGRRRGQFAKESF